MAKLGNTACRLDLPTDFVPLTSSTPIQGGRQVPRGATTSPEIVDLNDECSPNAQDFPKRSFNRRWDSSRGKIVNTSQPPLPMDQSWNCSHLSRSPLLKRSPAYENTSAVTQGESLNRCCRARVYPICDEESTRFLYQPVYSSYPTEESLASPVPISTSLPCFTPSEQTMPSYGAPYVPPVSHAIRRRRITVTQEIPSNMTINSMKRPATPTNPLSRSPPAMHLGDSSLKHNQAWMDLSKLETPPPIQSAVVTPRRPPVLPPRAQQPSTEESQRQRTEHVRRRLLVEDNIAGPVDPSHNDKSVLEEKDELLVKLDDLENVPVESQEASVSSMPKPSRPHIPVSTSVTLSQSSPSGTTIVSTIPLTESGQPGEYCGNIEFNIKFVFGENPELVITKGNEEAENKNK